MPEIQFRSFEPADAEAFRSMNEAWIEKYFGMEEKDHQTLGSPREYILDRGGQIFMATHEGKAIGCCALIPMKPGVYELGKMAVEESYQGQGIGRRMLEYAIGRAKEMGAAGLCLGSSKKLENAVHLYESVGFRHVPRERLGNYPYARANVFMEMDFAEEAQRV